MSDMLRFNNFALTAEEVADVIWLAAYMDEPVAVSERTITQSKAITVVNKTLPVNTAVMALGQTVEIPDSKEGPNNALTETTATQHVKTEIIHTTALRTPTTTTLPGQLMLARSLRPLLRRIPSYTEFVLDEIATAERTAQEYALTPVLRPKRVRWLDLAVIIDEWQTMDVWNETVRGFVELLQHLGAFRTIQIWRLVTEMENHGEGEESVGLRLYTAGDKASNGRFCNPGELIEPNGRRLILVLTDCTSPAWSSGAASALLSTWGTINMVAIIQMLPVSLWPTTALADSLQVYTTAKFSGTPNYQLQVELPWYWLGPKPVTSLPIPVVTLDSNALGPWSQMIVGKTVFQIPSVYLPRHLGEYAEKEKENSEESTPEERWRHFCVTASPTARELAGYLAAAPLLSLPVMRIVQREMLPKSEPSHLAEILRSKLFQRTVLTLTIDINVIQYNLEEEIRKFLLETIFLSDSQRVLQKVVEHLSQYYPQFQKFCAYILYPTSIDNFLIDSGDLPLATVAVTVLSRLGGKYASLAGRIKEQVISLTANNYSVSIAGNLVGEQKFSQQETFEPVPEFNIDTNLPSTSSISDGNLGLTVFNHLRAEEEPWLLDVFESPPEFDLICGSRSVIVFGEPGSGKTATRRMLVALSETPEGGPIRLVVEWRPHPPKTTAPFDSALVENQLQEIMDACAFSLLTYLSQQPDLFYRAPVWVHEVVVWFIRSYARGDLEVRTGSLQRDVSEKGYSFILDLLAWPVRTVLAADVGPEYVIRELLNALAELNLQGVWVLVDNLDIWNEASLELLSQGLTAFLSALALFEQNGFAYKIFLPATLERFLAGVSGITRRRVSVHYLHWTKAKLTQLLLRRLQMAIGPDVTTLTQICADPNLIYWLERCGVNTPAGWLEYARPLVVAYLDRHRNGLTTPINEAEWLEIRRRNPPKLSLDEANRRVRVGGRISKELTEQQFALFEYLYKKAGETCTRSQLHYLADLKLPSEPRPGDDLYEAPKDYSGQLETAIWRLRDAIEPAPQHPFFIVTVKGKGYRLENVFKL